MLRVLINSETARQKGLEDDDLVWVESRSGQVKGRLRTTDCVHVEVLGFYGPLGHWMKHELAEGKGSHHGSLLPMDMKTVAPVVPALEASARVRVYKAEEGGRK
jgi:anaerobic selenocysteine-containing dehydrogenase